VVGVPGAAGQARCVDGVGVWTWSGLTNARWFPRIGGWWPAFARAEASLTRPPLPGSPPPCWRVRDDPPFAFAFRARWRTTAMLLGMVLGYGLCVWGWQGDMPLTA